MMTSEMEIDWSQVKRKTLWHYEDLIDKLLNVLSYFFVQEYYNHSMPEAIKYTERIRQGYLQNKNEPVFTEEITASFSKLDGTGIRNYLDFVQRVNTKAKFKGFLQETNMSFDELIQILNYLFRWVLPFKCPVKELVDTIDHTDKTGLEILKKNKIRSNLDVLENFRTKVSRADFCRDTGLPHRFIQELVHRADISRLAYVRGKTIRHLCGGGYDTIEKIANADQKEMEVHMTAYYMTIGKSFSDFERVIPLSWMIGGARTLPRVVEG